MKSGTADDFMKNVPRGGEDTRNMVRPIPLLLKRRSRGWVAYGLACVHSQGVIHAYLKTSVFWSASETYHEPPNSEISLFRIIASHYSRTSVCQARYRILGLGPRPSRRLER